MALDYKSSLSRYRRYLQVVQTGPLWQASVFVISSLVLMIILVSLALRPTLITIASLLGQIKEQKLISQKLSDKIVAVNQAGLMLDQIGGRLSLLDEALPGNPEWAGALRRIGDEASESGVQLTQVTVADVPITGLGPKSLPTKTSNSLPTGVGSISFSITITGQYPQIRQFLDSLEKSRRIVMLSQVQFNKEINGSLTVIIRGQLAFMPKSP